MGRSDLASLWLHETSQAYHNWLRQRNHVKMAALPLRTLQCRLLCRMSRLLWVNPIHFSGPIEGQQWVITFFSNLPHHGRTMQPATMGWKEFAWRYQCSYGVGKSFRSTKIATNRSYSRCILHHLRRNFLSPTEQQGTKRKLERKSSVSIRRLPKSIILSSNSSSARRMTFQSSRIRAVSLPSSFCFSLISCFYFLLSVSYWLV